MVLKIRQEERLPYETMQELKKQGKELCAYIRNPLKTMEGTCALNGRECDEITRDHRDCTYCVDFYLRNYFRRP